MADHMARGQQLANEAEKKLLCCCFAFFDSNYEDAAELFRKSATSFKLAKSCLFQVSSHTLIFFTVFLISLFFLATCIIMIVIVFVCEVLETPNYNYFLIVNFWALVFSWKRKVCTFFVFCVTILLSDIVGLSIIAFFEIPNYQFLYF